MSRPKACLSKSEASGATQAQGEAGVRVARRLLAHNRHELEALRRGKSKNTCPDRELQNGLESLFFLPPRGTRRKGKKHKD